MKSSTGLLSLKPRIRGGAWVVFALTVLWVGFIFSRSLKTASVSSEESGNLLSLIQTASDRIGLTQFLNEIGASFLLTDHFIRKCAHFTEFCMLGILTSLSARDMFCGYWQIPVLPFGICVALTDEFLQLFSEGRSAQFSDVLLDSSGVLAGFLLCILLFRLSDRRKETRTAQSKREKTQWKKQ